jgi:hypothetical protein
MYFLSYGWYISIIFRSSPHLLDRYIPGYLKELQDGHAEELALFKDQLDNVRLSMVCFSCLSTVLYVGKS